MPADEEGNVSSKEINSQNIESASTRTASSARNSLRELQSRVGEFKKRREGRKSLVRDTEHARNGIF